MKTRLIATAAFTLLAACGGDRTATAPSPDATPNTRPSSTAELTIVEPEPGAVIEGTSVLVRVQVEGATVLEEASRDVRPDTGHLHIALDGKILTLLAGLEYEVTDLTPGQHLIEAEFAAADHGPFNPRVVATVTFGVT